MAAKVQDAVDDGSGSLKNKTISLSTKGAKARVTLNPAMPQFGFQFTNESLNELQIHLTISNRHMKSIAQRLRVHGGRSSVELGFANHITQKGQILLP